MDEDFQSCIVLGVRSDATVQEIKNAYRSLAREWHPDLVPDDGPKRRVAEEKLRSINRAYRTLRERRSARWAERSRPHPAPLGYDPIGWRESAAESAFAPKQEGEDSVYDRALDLHFRGLEDLRHGRCREAVSGLTQSICLVPNNRVALLALGRAHRSLGQHAKSAWAFERAALLDPESGESRYELGLALLAVGDTVGASRELEALSPIDPDLALLLGDSIESALNTDGSGNAAA